MLADYPDLTRLLNQLDSDDPAIAEQVMSLIYPELCRIARRMIAKRGAQPLEPEALVNETYIKLVKRSAPKCNNRSHFFNLAAGAMREVLTDRARRDYAQKRGGRDVQIVELDAEKLPDRTFSEELIALDRALERLAETRPRAVQVAQLRFCMGFTNAETGEALLISEYQVALDWKAARTFLLRELGQDSVLTRL